MEIVKTYADLEAQQKLLQNEEKWREDFEQRLLDLQVSNAEKLVNKKKDIEQKAAETLVKKQEQLEKKRLAYIAKAEKEALDISLDGELTKEQKDAIAKEAQEKFKLSEKATERARWKATKEHAKEEAKVAADALKSNLLGVGKSIKERANALKTAFTSEDAEGNTKFSPVKGLNALVNAVADLGKQLDNKVDEIAGYKTSIDTRLQGSKLATKSGSYWDQMGSNITKNIGASSLVKQSDVVGNLKSMVGQGIAYNVEQRAFLETIKESIADTFSATNGTLLRLVRIQQEDTTAARLGMESALTSFLNNMYETTEYMTQQANTIKASLEEASALMTAKSATEFEYQVQKWMGSLYSVGFDNTSGLSSALGQLASGDISSINNGGFGNLLVMAANKANLSVADMLANGLDSSDTNQLMQAMVEYLGQIYSETKGSNILAQQYANVFGLKASDLKAAANLAKSTGSIAGNNLNYGGMLGQLNNMANTMQDRISLGGRLSNVWENFKYGTAAGIANSPTLYLINKVAGLLDNVAGGLEWSLPLWMGTGTAQTFNTANILRAGALGTSILGGMGSMLGGLFSNGSGLLGKFGVGTGTTVARGTGQGLLTTSGSNTSESGYAGNSAGGDVYNKTMTDTTDSTTNQISAAEEEHTEATTTDINENVVMIYNLLNKVTGGGDSFKVDVGDSTTWTNVFKAGSLF